MSLNIAITGSSGLVGEALATELQKLQHSVLHLGRNQKLSPRKDFKLGDNINSDALNGVDILIHSAYDFTLIDRNDVYRVNVEGSKKLFNAAIKAGVKKIIFFSTVAAFDGCKSVYGQGKIEVENYLKDLVKINPSKLSVVVIRPGLICGNPKKGMFGALSKITKLPVFPIFDFGNQPLFLVHIDDLVQLVSKFAIETIVDPYVLTYAANKNPMRFKEILTTISSDKHKSKIFIPIPSMFAYLGFCTAEALKLKLPFRSDSLKSLLNPPNIQMVQDYISKSNQNFRQPI